MGDGWHTMRVDEVSERLGTDADEGLESGEASTRLERHGPNVLREADATPWYVTLASQFRSPLIYILMLAAVLTIALDEYFDASVIAAVLVLNASIGFVQERKAEESVRALMQLISPTASVVRAGRTTTIDSTDLVPGDVVLLESGVRVPADLRLASVSSLRVDESLLTGESVPVEKSTTPVDQQSPLGDRLGMAFSGSIVASGRGRGLVVGTAIDTELGRIAEEIRQTELVESPLQERMRRFAHIIGVVIGVSTVLTFALGLWLGEEVGEMLLVSAALAVAAIPEGLPVVLTVALALGVRRMARRNAIIRRLAAVETLGSTTLIGSDKTGTLTQNRMTVNELWAGGVLHHSDELDLPPAHEADPRHDGSGRDDPLSLALLAGVLANEARLTRGDEGLVGEGDPTETAFLLHGARHDLDPDAARRTWRSVGEIPFESEHRYAASFREHDGTHHVFVKGAPERVMAMCTDRAAADGTTGPLDVDEIRRVNEEMAGRGLRVLACAHRTLDSPPDGSRPDEPTGLTFLGLVGLLDPPRDGVRDAIARCRQAGQRTIMITGDHAATARAIAAQVGIVDDDDAPVLTGPELDDMDDDALRDRIDEVSVFARVSPQHKLRIVLLAKDLGHVVAVTGDGVNDAPALKNADIGIAMGAGGTDVARDASDIVLADDNFVSIHAAVEEGRITFDNVRKVTFFLVSTGFGTFVIIPVALVLDWPLILVPAQLLWANLVTKGLQDLALAFEPGEPDVLDHPPRARREPVLNAVLWWRTLLVGAVMGAGTLVMFDWAHSGEDTLVAAQTVALTTLVVFQAFHLGSSRSERRSILQVPVSSNRFLLYAQVGALALHVGALHFPPTQFVLRVEPIGLDAWVRLVAVAATVLVVVEIDKAVRRGLDRRRSTT
ncbi:MAG: cation-translocating P-type ATPase [Acidimicrobiales bacterium]